MTGEEFTRLCYKEKESVVEEYFDEASECETAVILRRLIQGGANRNELYELVDKLLSENYYRLLLALDGEASLAGVQQCYKLYGEDGVLLNECGELEAGAYELFFGYEKTKE